MANHWFKLLLCLDIVLNSHRVHATGGDVRIGDMNCYVSGSKDSNTSVILSSDIFGYGVLHLRQFADKVSAASGFYVVVPDFFFGDPFVANVSKKESWLNKHSPINGTKYAKRLISALKAEGIKKIGAAGFCWGGNVTVGLANSSHYIQAAVLLHPTYVTVEDIQNVKVPISILGGQNDSTLLPTLVEQFKSALKKNHKIHNHSSIKIFPNATHGFSTKYTDGDFPAEVRAEEARNDTLKWFLKYLK